LSACAYGLEDGVLEGVEQTLEQNIIGVQFNPERRSDLPPHFERLFQWLIKVASDS
jgi:gamma-glutamyl-gamma-aminobutyrate hydrolase PuuD